MGFAFAKADGYEADDFLAAGVAFEEARGGEALVASGDRDTFQLVSERTSVLQPQKGGGPLARIGPAEVRERYGVDPKQVPDFIALRGDPSDKIPGARGVGAKTAADLLNAVREPRSCARTTAASPPRRRRSGSTGTSRRWTPRRRCRRSRSRSRRGTGAAALAAGVGAGEARGPPGGAVELLTNPALAHLHPTGNHPERQDRLLGLGGETVERYATEEQLARVHTEQHLALLRAIDRPAHLDADTVRLGDVVGSGDARGRHHARGGRPWRLRARAPARPPRARRPRDGLLPAQQRRGRGALRAGGARARAGRDRRLRRAPRQRHRGDLPRRRLRPLRLAAPVAVLSGHRRPGHERRDDAQPAAAGRLRRRGVPRGLRERGRAGGARVSRRTSCSSRPASTRTRRIRWPRWR